MKKYLYIVLLLIVGLIGYFLGLYVNDENDFHVVTIDSINSSELDIQEWKMVQDIKIKYLDDIGLVVKWQSGAYMIDDTWESAHWIQRFEPWLNERTDIEYHVEWEE